MFFFLPKIVFLWFVFFFLEKFNPYWLTQSQLLFFFISRTGNKKKQHFYSLTRFFPQSVQKQTLPGKKKIRYLCSPLEHMCWLPVFYVLHFYKKQFRGFELYWLVSAYYNWYFKSFCEFRISVLCFQKVKKLLI